MLAVPSLARAGVTASCGVPGRLVLCRREFSSNTRAAASALARRLPWAAVCMCCGHRGRTRELRIAEEDAGGF